jgi:UDP-N-acetylglucosamine diphosphorylase/glucosamine-1-phosphate N-acetyltransferase
MTQRLVLFDDERARSFEPLVACRPVCELLAGVATIRERWEDALGARAEGFVSSPHLVEFDEERAASFHSGELPAGCIVANSRFVPTLYHDRSASEVNGEAASGTDADIWLAAGRVAAVRVGEHVSTSDLADGALRLDKLAIAGHRKAELQGIWMEDIWDLIRYLPSQIVSDITAIHAAPSTSHLRGRIAPREIVPQVRLRETAAILGEGPVLVSTGATVDPHVVFDARSGPILVSNDAVIRSFAMIEGPCFIGAHTTVLGGRIAGSSIGERCKVAGEISNTVILGYSNKAHDGFIGHSYLGRWVNIGAGTITSNLKNTYGDVSLWTPRGERDTGMQFLGSFFGDHARTGIGTMLSTGTVVGTGANVFGGEMPPRYVPPFSWGVGHNLEEYRFDKFLEVAERVMSRRGMHLSDGSRRHYEEVHRMLRTTGRSG